MSIQRYSLDATMEPDDTGGWVGFGVYQRQRDEHRQNMDQLLDHADLLARAVERLLSSDREDERRYARDTLAAYRHDYPEEAQ